MKFDSHKAHANIMDKASSPSSDNCSVSTDNTVIRRSISKEANEGANDSYSQNFVLSVTDTSSAHESEGVDDEIEVYDDVERQFAFEKQKAIDDANLPTTG